MPPERFFDNFIDCQDFEVDDISQFPIVLTQIKKFAVNGGLRDMNPDVPVESEFVYFDNNHPDEPTERQSSDKTPNEESLFEDIPHISSSSALYGNENQPQPTFTETDHGVKPYLQVKKRSTGASVNLPPSGRQSMDKLNLPRIAKGRISPTTIKNKLTSLASKGDDAWDNIKDNLKKVNSQGQPWETIKDNVKRIKNHNSCQESAVNPKKSDEMLENMKDKQSAALENMKGSLGPKMKESDATNNVRNNLKFNQNSIDPPKKRQNGDTSRSESRKAHVPVTVGKESNKSRELSLGHVIRSSSSKRDQPLTYSSTDRPNQNPAGLTESVVSEDPQCPLANSIIELLCEIFRGHNSWICLDYVQSAFMGVFGGIFEW